MTFYGPIKEMRVSRNTSVVIRRRLSGFSKIQKDFQLRFGMI